MNEYIITYISGESQRALKFTTSAESEGEAIEIWEANMERLDDLCEFVSIKEVA